MDKIIRLAEKYIKECNWQDFALLKFCLCAIGIVIGMCIPKNAKKTAAVIAFAVFVATYVPLMAKFLRVATTETKYICK